MGLKQAIAKLERLGFEADPVGQKWVHREYDLEVTSFELVNDPKGAIDRMLDEATSLD